MTVVGTLIKLFAVQKDRFYLNIISQSICGIAQVFMLSIPSKVANTWFGAGEVSTACAIGVTWTQIGLALGALLPTLMVPNVKDDAEVAAGFTSLFILDNIASITMFVVVLFCFRSSPDSPPSQSQELKINNNREIEIEYKGSFAKLLQERDFILVLICFGASYGNWNSMGIMINEIYLSFFPENGKYLGILVLVGILSGGVFGTLLFGYILDKTHQYKKVSFCVLALNCIFWICLSISFQLQSEIGSFIFIPAFGFTSGSLMVITYEFAIETSYPNPEELSTGLMNAAIYLFAIFNVIILEMVFKMAGILAGQILMAIDYSACAALVLLISSDLKRRKANLLEHPLKNYGSSDE
ncbi:hypothetical protein WA026_008466 [Henosepilachna vigintioctopunctata]|uniref:Uncharacterized protein n=1 Tax=Henosepilachna vigintioctopunctata TaxID=420089 RepID=A0AAW1U8M8_9CUCU